MSLLMVKCMHGNCLGVFLFCSLISNNICMTMCMFILVYPPFFLSIQQCNTSYLIVWVGGLHNIAK